MHRVGMERIRIEILKKGDRYKTAPTPAASAILAEGKDGLPREVDKTGSAGRGRKHGMVTPPVPRKSAEFCALETDVVKAVELCKTLARSGRATSREHQGYASGKGRG